MSNMGQTLRSYFYSCKSNSLIQTAASSITLRISLIAPSKPKIEQSLIMWWINNEGALQLQAGLSSIFHLWSISPECLCPVWILDLNPNHVILVGCSRQVCGDFFMWLCQTGFCFFHSANLLFKRTSVVRHSGFFISIWAFEEI